VTQELSGTATSYPEPAEPYGLQRATSLSEIAAVYGTAHVEGQLAVRSTRAPPMSARLRTALRFRAT
jgi:hypothetical protein